MPPTNAPDIVHRNERAPEPVDRSVGPPEEGGNVTIDGAHIAKEINPRRRQGPPATVAADLTPAMAPGSARTVVLEGGPCDGAEARVPRSAAEHRVPVARTDGSGVVGQVERAVRSSEKCPDGRVVQAVVGGDFGAALYLRTDRRDDDGRAVFEFAGVE